MSKSLSKLLENYQTGIITLFELKSLFFQKLGADGNSDEGNPFIGLELPGGIYAALADCAKQFPATDKGWLQIGSCCCRIANCIHATKTAPGFDVLRRGVQGFHQYAPTFLQAKIDRLLKTISEKTSHYSFHIPDQPQLRELIEIGTDAVPILLEHIVDARIADQAGYEGYDFNDYAPWYAIMALEKITGANPIKPEHRGRLYDMTDDWLAWKPEDENDEDKEKLP